MGHKLTMSGLCQEEEKVKAVVAMPAPEDKRGSTIPIEKCDILG